MLFVDDKPVFGTIVEAQLQPDERKRFTWPLYAISARARYECPFVVVIVTPDSATARWAGQPFDLGGGMHYQVHVIGPDGIPVVTALDHAIREPQLAVLSVMAHGRVIRRARSRSRRPRLRGSSSCPKNSACYIRHSSNPR
ncbi:MAG: hypothetical protein H0V17_21770 [Deltaproteobacteria bacterium]|nr:hypothetical protein [Deltaproteobacteria bacterium]